MPYPWRCLYVEMQLTIKLGRRFEGPAWLERELARDGSGTTGIQLNRWALPSISSYEDATQRGVNRDRVPGARTFWLSGSPARSPVGRAETTGISTIEGKPWRKRRQTETWRRRQKRPAVSREGTSCGSAPLPEQSWWGVLLAVALLSGDGSSAPGVGSTADTAPDFSFTLYQGQGQLGADALNLSDLQGTPVVVNFWAGLCPPCRAEMPDLQEFHEAFKDRVILVGVDLGQFTGLGSKQDAQDLLTSLEVTYPAGFTNDAGVVSRYQVLSMPTTLFINSKGEIFKKWSGALNGDVLAKVTEEMLSEESAG